LFFAAALVTAAEAGLGPLIMALIPELFSGRARVTATMIFYFALTCSVALGYVGAGAAIAALDTIPSWPAPLAGLESWRLAFLFAAAPFPLFLLLVALLPIGRAHRKQADLSSPAAPILPFLKGQWRTVTFVFGGLALCGVSAHTMFAWTPVSMMRIFGVSAAEIGVIIGPIAAASSLIGIAIGTFAAKRAQQRIGFRAMPRLIWVSLCFAAPILILIPFATAPWQVYTLIGVQLVIATISGASTVSLLQEMAPAAVRTRVMAIYTMLYTPALGLGVAAAGAVADLLPGNARGLFLASLFIGLPALLVSVLLLRLAEQPFERTAQENARQEQDAPSPQATALMDADA
jgi:MFS family permease